MKKAEEIRKNMFAIVWELENTEPHEKLKKRLKIELEVLYDIIGDEIEEEWWDRIEALIAEDD